jgi:hypothetical protein
MAIPIPVSPLTPNEAKARKLYIEASQLNKQAQEYEAKAFKLETQADPSQKVAKLVCAVDSKSNLKEATPDQHLEATEQETTPTTTTSRPGTRARAKKQCARSGEAKVQKAAFKKTVAQRLEKVAQCHIDNMQNDGACITGYIKHLDHVRNTRAMLNITCDFFGDDRFEEYTKDHHDWKETDVFSRERAAKLVKKLTETLEHKHQIRIYKCEEGNVNCNLPKLVVDLEMCLLGTDGADFSGEDSTTDGTDLCEEHGASTSDSD